MSKLAFGDLLSGETPFDTSTSELLVSGISTRQELSQFEAENIALAFTKYFRGDPLQEIAPFDFAWLKQLHREMFGDGQGDFARTTAISAAHGNTSTNVSMIYSKTSITGLSRSTPFRMEMDVGLEL